MNPDSDFSFSDTPVETPLSSEPSIHLPFALMCCAVAVFLWAQTSALFNQATEMKKNQTAMKEAYAKREVLVKQSRDIQQKLQDLIMDLLILAKTDEDAKQIVAKYNIQQNVANAPAAPTK